ncbi:unnamed protein product [Brassica napus]|uniref:(rape) hypothetical protein n=1 Tax=Brassica napus TaxID=3708 RepID=A0A816LEL4_BRANA|nr:unnamed protein product [Brassica napus]
MLYFEFFKMTLNYKNEETFICYIYFLNDFKIQLILYFSYMLEFSYMLYFEFF